MSAFHGSWFVEQKASQQDIHYASRSLFGKLKQQVPFRAGRKPFVSSSSRRGAIALVSVPSEILGKISRINSTLATCTCKLRLVLKKITLNKNSKIKITIENRSNQNLEIKVKCFRSEMFSHQKTNTNSICFNSQVFGPANVNSIHLEFGRLKTNCDCFTSRMMK